MSSYIQHKVLDQYAIRYLFPDDGDGESALANDDDFDDDDGDDDGVVAVHVCIGLHCQYKFSHSHVKIDSPSCRILVDSFLHAMRAPLE